MLKSSCTKQLPTDCSMLHLIICRWTNAWNENNSLGSKNPSLGSARSHGLQYCTSLSLGMKAKWQGTCPSFVIRKRSFWSCLNFTSRNANCRTNITASQWHRSRVSPSSFTDCKDLLILHHRLEAGFLFYFQDNYGYVAKRHRWKEVVLHSIHCPNDLLKHLFAALLIWDFHLRHERTETSAHQHNNMCWFIIFNQNSLHIITSELYSLYLKYYWRILNLIKKV